MPDVFEVPCGGADGRRATTTLDLRAGALVQISGQPDWDAERCGTVGVVTGKDALGNYVIKLQSGGDRAVRTLGAWWIREAQAGSVDAVPVAPLHSGHWFRPHTTVEARRFLLNGPGLGCLRAKECVTRIRKSNRRRSDAAPTETRCR